jgi:hypothetical protein
LSHLKALIDPKLNEDDITVLVAKRVIAGSAEEREMLNAVGNCLAS